MSDYTIARRYALALTQEAQARGLTAKVDADIESIDEAMRASRELVRLFESPVIPREKKEAVVQGLFASRVQPVTLGFLRLLINKQREDIFPTVVRAYRTLRDQQEGIVEAEAHTAVTLSSSQQQRLAAVLESATGKKVRLRINEDPALIGGLTVRVGDVVYDGSVRHQLKTLRQQLEHPNVASS